MADPVGAVDPGGPSLDELWSNYARWAAPVYAEVMTPLWRAPMSLSRLPAATQPGAAPWQPTAHSQAGPVPCPGTGLWPAQMWPLLWAAAMATPDPLTCVVGWQRAGSARRDGVTHLGAANAPHREAPITPQPEPRPAPEPERLVLAPPPEAASADADLTPPSLVPAAGPATRRDELIARLARARVLARTWQPACARLLAQIRVHASVRLPASAHLPHAISWISLSRRAKLCVSIAMAAVAAGVLVIALAPNPAPAPPSVTHVTIMSASQPARDSLFDYQHGTLWPGPRTARLAPLPDASPASRAACVARLGSNPPSQVRPRRGQRICLKLKGQPTSFGIAAIEDATPTSVKAAVTIWPLGAASGLGQLRENPGQAPNRLLNWP